MGEQINSQQIRDELLKVSDAFYQNRIEDGLNVLPGFVQTLMAFAPCVKPEEIGNYSGILKDILGTMESKDYIMLADLLVYELDPLLGAY